MRSAETGAGIHPRGQTFPGWTSRPGGWEEIIESSTAPQKNPFMVSLPPSCPNPALSKALGGGSHQAGEAFPLFALRPKSPPCPQPHAPPALGRDVLPERLRGARLALLPPKPRLISCDPSLAGSGLRASPLRRRWRGLKKQRGPVTAPAPSPDSAGVGQITVWLQP